MRLHAEIGRGWQVAALVATVLTGCVYTEDEACGPNMRFAAELGVCLCNDDAILEGRGCTACAADEVVVGAVCACAPGEAKGEDGLCGVVQGFGAPCDATTSCTSATYGYCSVRGGIGSCTNRCAVDTDCPASYMCADWEPTPSCRTFTGYGATCAGPADCASYDASFCIQGHCTVHGCTVGTDDCPRDTMCCDFSTYGIGTLCAPAGSCS